MLQKSKGTFCPSNRLCDYQQFVSTVRNVIREEILMNLYSGLNCSFIKEILVVTFAILGGLKSGSCCICRRYRIN